jgi:hypothetical protein
VSSWLRSALLISPLLAGLSCAPDATPWLPAPPIRSANDEVPAPEPSASAPPYTLSEPTSSALPAASSAPGSAPPGSAGAPLAPHAFPPPAFAPPHARSAAAGDGTWKPIDPASSKGGDDATLWKAVVHPHTIRKDIEVTVVAIDLDRASLHLVAGTLEPEQKGGPGLVPTAAQASLIAVFNGGFKAKHGAFGMKVDGEVLLPPKEGACTVGILDDGTVRIGSWGSLGAAAGELFSYRQTPPCLVEAGAINAELLGGAKPRKWGMAEDGRLDVRRSALGLDASGKTLFYAMAEWSTPVEVAEAIKLAGAVAAAELDINWSYTKFLFFGRPSPGAPLEVTSALVPKTKHTRTGYVAKPAERDFFYIARRQRPLPDSTSR